MTTPDTKNGITKDSTLQVNVNPLETITNQRLDSEKTYTVSDLMQDPTNKAGITKDSTFVVDVPDHLETITNQRLNSETTYTISSLMQDPTNNVGITKDSTLIVDVPEPVYPEVTFNTITVNNTYYTLSQLTNNQSNYFDKYSQIKCNISTEKPTIKYLGVSEIDNSFYKEINLNDFNKSTGSYDYYATDVILVFGLDVGRFFFGYNNSTGTYNYGHHCLYHNLTHTTYATPQVVRFLDSNKTELFRTVIQSDQIINIDRGLAYLNNSFNIDCGNTTYNNYWKNNTG